MELTKINTIWRQIARMRAGVAYKLNTHTQAPGFLSYTAGEAARNEPSPAGNMVVIWVYWIHDHGTRIATKEEVEAIRQRCKDYTGMTINGDELLLCTEEYMEMLKQSKLITIVQTYKAELFVL